MSSVPAVIPVDEPRPLVSVTATGGIISPLVTAQQAKEAWAAYQDLTRAILDESDYQTTGSKKFKKKSAWRKYMRFYGLEEDPAATRVEVTRDARAHPIYAVAYSVVRSPNGKPYTGYHECHVTERCCPAAEGLFCEKKEWSSHKCCAQGCSGKIHWSHPGDIPATAVTRAKNRAISDAIGAGEVSAEEIGERGSSEDEEAPPAAVKCPNCGKEGTIIQGKAEFGGGWLCWKKRGGCGAKFDVDPATLQQSQQSSGQQAKRAAGPEEETEEQRHQRAVRLFKDVCTLTGLPPADVADYLREMLGAEDLESVDDFSKITKLNLVWDANQKKPGAGSALVLEKAQRWRASHMPDEKGPQPAPKSRSGRAAATPEPFLSLYARVGAKAGQDGLKLLNEYLDRQMGHHKIMGLVDGTEEEKRFRNLLESLAGLEIQQLRNLLLGSERSLDLQPEEAEVA